MLASIRPCPTNCFYWRWTIPLCLHKRKKTSKINSWTASKPTVSISKPVATFPKQKRPCRHHSSHKSATMGWQKRYQRLLPLHHQWWCWVPHWCCDPTVFFCGTFTALALGVLEQNPAPPLFLALTHGCLFPSFHRHEHFLPTLRRYIGMDPGHNTVDHHGRSK